MASFVNPSKNGNKYQALAQLAQSSQPEKMYDMNLRLLPPSHRTFCLEVWLWQRGGGEGKRMQHIHSTLGENAAGLSNERTSIIRVCALLPFPSPSTTFASAAALLVQQRFPRTYRNSLIDARSRPKKQLFQFIEPKCTSVVI